MSTAQRIADMFDNDGQLFVINGLEIEKVCESSYPACVEQEWDHEATRWVFPDGSWLAIVGACWFTDNDADGENCYWPGD